MRFQRFFSHEKIASVAAGLALGAAAHGEDGYDLWLRYRPLPAERIERYLPHIKYLMASQSPTFDAATAELNRGLKGLLDRARQLADHLADGEIVLGTPHDSAVIRGMNLPLAEVGKEGFILRAATVEGKKITVIAGNQEVGVLYGAFRYLSLLQTGQSIDSLNLVDSPKLQLRILDHWDNLDGSVERGYAGTSIWKWPELPEVVDPRYTDYARVNASVGINGAVLNNVNAKSDSLTAPYIAKAKAIAAVLRPYGIRVYLSARFSAPIELGGLKTADPLDPAVRIWWNKKAEEIYAAIPDFGGFVVKANSEGQPGPGDYHRTHADGANMIAEAVAPHGGIVMWRAFVYSRRDEDRAKQAYSEFKPLDGKFLPNVLVQIKNGPIDFQPREPFHPLFGAMPDTNEILEVQITKEYLGQKTHLVYVTPTFEETLRADTFTKGKGSTVAKVIGGNLEAHRLTGMAGVANIGSDRDWCGSDFNQADWYGFGCLAWNPDTSAHEIASDWAKMTFTDNPAFVDPVVKMMMNSREAVVDYMTPLGLHHQMATAHHYGPGPWVGNLKPLEWNPTYYAQADAKGVGFDRTSSGSDALSQYSAEAAQAWQDPRKTDPKFLLWFHHVPWTFPMRDGHTLWDELVLKYDQGVEQVKEMRQTWDSMRDFVDPQRFDAVSANLKTQELAAQWWRDSMIAYFQSKCQLPLPVGHEAPQHDLAYYESNECP